MIKRLFAATILSATLPLSTAFARDLPSPEGDVVLTITGHIENFNADGVANFDLAMLSAIEQRETTTQTPWHEGTPTFSGPLGTALFDAVGASGLNVRITALNDYVVEVPMEDFLEYPVIFATHIDGEPMSVRDKGPLFLIYPFAEYPELFNEVQFGRSAWQIREIEVLD